MAGVISRSAYVEAEAPDKFERGSTDAVCVIGMIGVQVQGSVQTGERIYTSTVNDGIAIPESHLPIGSFFTKENTMLGMAMEPHTPRRPGDFDLVKCFVCIVLGISSQQVAQQVQHVLDTMETNLKNEVKKSSKKTWRRIYCLAGLALFLLVFTGFLLYQLLAPGTFYRYWRCSIGAKPGHRMTYEFKWDGKKVEITCLDFDYDSLVKKLKDTVESSDIKMFNHTKTGVRYCLNLDHCAYGGETDGGFFRKTVKGGLVLVHSCPCDYNKPVFKFIDDAQWCAYNTKKPLKGTLKCTPEQCTQDEINYSPYYPTFKRLNETKPEKFCRQFKFVEDKP